MRNTLLATAALISIGYMSVPAYAGETVSQAQAQLIADEQQLNTDQANGNTAAAQQDSINVSNDMMAVNNAQLSSSYNNANSAPTYPEGQGVTTYEVSTAATDDSDNPVVSSTPIDVSDISSTTAAAQSAAQSAAAAEEAAQQQVYDNSIAQQGTFMNSEMNLYTGTDDKNIASAQQNLQNVANSYGYDGDGYGYYGGDYTADGADSRLASCPGGPSSGCAAYANVYAYDYYDDDYWGYYDASEQLYEQDLQYQQAQNAVTNAENQKTADQNEVNNFEANIAF